MKLRPGTPRGTGNMTGGSTRSSGTRTGTRAPAVAGNGGGAALAERLRNSLSRTYNTKRTS